MCLRHDWKNFFFMKARSVCLGSIPSNTFLPSNSNSEYVTQLKINSNKIARTGHNLLCLKHTDGGESFLGKLSCSFGLDTREAKTSSKENGPNDVGDIADRKRTKW